MAALPLLPIVRSRVRQVFVIRLLLVIPTLDRSGAEQQLTLLATHLPRDEFEVHVVALTRSGPYAADLQAAGIPLTVLNKRFKFDPLAGYRLRSVIQKFQPDILHTWLFAANAYGRLAVGSSPAFPVIVSERCVDSWKAGWQLRCDRWLAPRTTRLVGNSQSVTDFYADLGLPRERLAVIPNGLDVRPQDVLTDEGRRSRPSDSALQSLRQSLNIPAEARVIGYAGRLARQKRLPDLLWAFELLHVLHPDVVLLIAGDGPERASLEEFSKKIGVHGQTRFLGHRSDIRALLPLLDVFWLASDFEGMSNSIMEAMAAGLPVVASDIPPNRELVVQAETGFLVPVGDRVAYAQFTSQLLNDADLAQRQGTAGQQRIRDQFSVGAMVAGYADLYRAVAGSRAASPARA